MRRFWLACPAARLPPHPSLWPARQRHPQSQPRQRPRTPGRGATSRTRRGGGDARSAAALSLLRRPHAHHRHLRALEPAPCAASGVLANWDDRVVIPHSVSFSCAVTLSPRPATSCALGVEPRRSATTFPISMADNTPVRARCVVVQVLTHRIARPFSYLLAAPKLQISIAQRRRPAGSFLGDFRTAAGIRNPSRKPKGGLMNDNSGKLPII